MPIIVDDNTNYDLQLFLLKIDQSLHYVLFFGYHNSNFTKFYCLKFYNAAFTISFHTVVYLPFSL